MGRGDGGGAFPVPTLKLSILAGTGKLFTKVGKEAQFLGGAVVWNGYISKILNEHKNEFSQKDYGTCIVRFIVNKEGQVSDIKAVEMADSKLAEVVIDAI